MRSEQMAQSSRRRSRACHADVVITILANDAAVNAIVFDSGECLPSLGADRVHVSMSTIGLSTVRRLTAAHVATGCDFISAPVFGRPDAAEAAALSVVAAGPKPTIERLSPVFGAIAKQVSIVGETPFHANVAKLCGNFLLLGSIEGLAEALGFARAQGVAPPALLDVLTGTICTAPFYRSYGMSMIEERFTPAGFRLGLALKDIELLAGAASEARVAMPSADALERLIGLAAECGLQDHDVSVIATLDRSDCRPGVASGLSRQPPDGME